MIDLKKWDGFWTRLFSSSAKVGRREPGFQEIGGEVGVPLTKNSRPMNEDVALSLSAVWACSRIIAYAVASMPIHINRVDANGTRTRDEDHALDELLNFAPNALQTRAEFFVTLIINQLLWGNAYFHIIRAKNNRIVSLWPLMSSQMQVELMPTGRKRFIYTEGGERREYDDKEIWHIPSMNSNGVVGLSMMAFGARSFRIAEAADSRVATLASNGFKSSGVLMVPGALKPEQREGMRKKHSDLQEEGETLKILEGNMKFQPLSIPPKDMQLIESRRFQVEEIARIFGVPSVLINETSASTAWGSGIAEIKEGFWTLTLSPLVQSIEQSIERWLIGRAQRRTLSVEFDMTAFLRGDEKTRIANNSAAIQAGTLTINEARKREGRAPVEGGDTVFLQAQMRPLDSLLNPPEPAVPAAAPGGGEPIEDDETTDDEPANDNPADDERDDDKKAA